jgi:hypothetical protein
MKQRIWKAGTAAIAVMFAISAQPLSSAAAVPITPAATVAADGALADPDAVLGKGWRSSADFAVTGVGDSRGYHLYIAREKKAFAWSTLATLYSPQMDFGPWLGQVCVTGSGKYAVAVFAPKMAVNKPTLRQAGGLAAVVDIATGKATHVATGVSLSYFNPACGPTDRVLLTRSVGEEGQQTDLLTIDAKTAAITQTRHIAGQLTTPAPGQDGDYGIAHGGLVQIGPDGTLTPLVRPSGRVSGVYATGSHGVDLVTVDGQRAVAQRFAAGKLTVLATGPWNRLQLIGQGGQSTLVGEVSMAGPDVPELRTLAVDRRVETVSAQGHLVVDEVVSSQTRAAGSDPLARTDGSRAGSAQITARVPGRSAYQASVVTAAAPTLSVTVAARASTTLTPRPIGPPKCAVGRNDPQIQAFQNGHQQVEWAVDKAVHGNLNVARPADFLKTGQPAYTPQGLFPRLPLAGGGSVPAQVMLGILAQETNMSEASWHAVPGDTGNPLISDYYGTRYLENINDIDYAHADCGYGIGQVTTGMTTADGDTVYTKQQRIALATDYAAGIAASLDVLIDKWNQIYSDPAGRSWIGGGDPQYIQSWFLAVWAYNSGFHPSSDAGNNDGHWGVGYLNNPANPNYPPDRDPFLRYTYADAEHPGDWPYPELVMGWIENPQLKGTPSWPAYARPDFGHSAPDILGIKFLAQPGRDTFCSALNGCHADDTDPCPAWDSSCWWHGHATVATCTNDDNNECADEHLSYGSGSDEPGVDRIYAEDCLVFDGNDDADKDPSRPVTVVGNLPDPSRYALHCFEQPYGGKFTLRAGYPAGNVNVPVGQIDLHQLGAGYMGHSWFSHMYGAGNGWDHPPGYHHMVGSWTPDLPAENGEHQRYDVLVHLPSHGGEAEVEYVVVKGPDDPDADSCVLDQSTWTFPWENGTDQWRYIGHYDLEPGAQVQLNNNQSGADGSENIAWDAVAFVPIGDNPGHNCDDSYPPLF